MNEIDKPAVPVITLELPPNSITESLPENFTINKPQYRIYNPNPHTMYVHKKP